MSQSKAHQQLVIASARALRILQPELVVRLDLQDAPGDPIPPIVGGYRPDIYATSAETGECVLIAEAKTDRDLDREHTVLQIEAFVSHLESRAVERASFVLAVNGRVADRAKAILRLLFSEKPPSCLSIRVFDGLDFWTLSKEGGRLWHLF